MTMEDFENELISKGYSVDAPLQDLTKYTNGSIRITHRENPFDTSFISMYCTSNKTIREWQYPGRDWKKLYEIYEDILNIVKKEDRKGKINKILKGSLV